jgi:release factor glutamine methyltransferase
LKLQDHIDAGRQRLVAAGFAPGAAAVDAQVLARHTLGWDLARLLARQRDDPPDGFGARFDAAIARRAAREPVAMIVGSREFWGRDFAVTRATLVPRPETELIMEEALRILPPGSPTIVDIGTGTGCLAISLAAERTGARVVATDISHDALLVASANARSHGVEARVRFVACDLADALTLDADLIVSNPPYVPETSAPALVPDVLHYEPVTALFGGGDGLAVIERLLASTARLLAPGAALIVEFGDGQEERVCEAAAREGWTVWRMLHDLQGIARTAVLGRSRG